MVVVVVVVVVVVMRREEKGFMEKGEGGMKEGDGRKRVSKVEKF